MHFSVQCSAYLLVMCCRLLECSEVLAAPLRQTGHADKRPLEISLNVIHSKDATKPLLVVNYFNAGSESVELWLPSRKGRRVLGFNNGSELPLFRGVTIRIDGELPRFVQNVHSLSNPVFSRRLKLKPGERATLRMPLNEICRVPEDWRSISVATSEISGVEAKGVGNLTIRHIRHTFLDPIHISAAPVVPMNFDDPKVSVRFQNIGKKPFILPLPKPGAETKLFWSVDATIDRKKVSSSGTRSPEGGYTKWTRFVELEPGESTEITIRLKDYFKIPEDWKLIEIGSGQFSLPKKDANRHMNPEFQDTLTLTRPLQKPVNVPHEVWNQSNDRVRWFLYHQQEELEKLKSKTGAKRR